MDRVSKAPFPPYVLPVRRADGAAASIARDPRVARATVFKQLQELRARNWEFPTSPLDLHRSGIVIEVCSVTQQRTSQQEARRHD
jgi:hypothetical protein